MGITRSEYGTAKADAFAAQSIIDSSNATASKIQNLITTNQSLGVSTSALEAQLASVNARISTANQTLTAANNTINEFQNQATIPSDSDVAREQRAQNSSLVDTTDPSAPAQPNNSAGTPQPGTRVVPGVPAGAELASKPRPNIVFNDVTGNKIGEDLRVKIRVPSKYLTAATVGMNGELEQLGGIIFPYTPSISFESKADYSPQQPLHSNFAINFYQKSSIGSISISGKFSVQNEKDAGVYIATMHLLKALTKMRSGGTLGDPDSGAPPPVCRLDGHGAMILNNVPVVITSYKIDLPDSVDYFTLPSNQTYSATSVPTISTISITCLPMYSRNEMQNFSVTGYLNDYSYRRQGYI